VRTHLHNDDWGYETNCFVCERRNEQGLRIAFFHDDQRSIVEAEFSLGDAYSGAPTLLHGGLQLAILDEAMAWATIAIAGKWALTSASTAQFLGQVVVDAVHVVEASVVSTAPDEIKTTARILDQNRIELTTATATFVPVGDAIATKLVGEVDPSLRGFLRDEGPQAGLPSDEK
jgi:acyl-coenzyme A thioesterase PaaI-like protein